jgi:hypothetical protein
MTAVGGSALPSLGSFSGRERIRYSLNLADPAEWPRPGHHRPVGKCRCPATLLTVAIILTLVAVYQWTARLGVLGVAQMELMARYWQGVLGTTALAAGSWLAWLTV